MAEDKPTESAEDKEYRSKSTRHLFRGALFGALGAASFFGLLQNTVGMALKAFSTEAVGAAAAATSGAGTAAAGFLGVTPMGWVLIAGMMAAGVAFTYMAQIEATKLKEVQDDRLARKNAECLTRGKCVTVQPEYPQNQRADGKPWGNVVQAAQAHVNGRVPS